MSYSAAEYETARRILEQRRSRAEKTREQRHDEVTAKIPEILNIEREMARAGLAVVKALSLGEDAVNYVKQLEQSNLDAQRRRTILLIENGYPPDYLQPQYTCAVCEDKGFVAGRMCACHKRLLRKLAYEKLSSRFPLESCTFETFDLRYYPETGGDVSPRKRMTSVLEFCKQYADDFGAGSPSLLMYGKTGLGKTHLSLAIAGKVLQKDGGVIYASAQNLFNQLENEKFGRSDSAGTEETLIECDLLILDDLGAEFRTQFTVSAVYNLINSRLLAGKPTIVSTNLEPQEIEAAYTQRIASRILNEYTLLRFDGADIRQIKTRT